uniref:Ubiquitin fusion degradation protein 1 n=1 Tax=Globodera rostochiensis TaxID=31243 RepID=A0A914ICQ3_GLORO
MADIQKTIQTLEREYAEQKELFEKWKEENASEADTEPYNAYVEQFQGWEKDVMDNLKDLRASIARQPVAPEPELPMVDLDTQLNTLLDRVDAPQFILAFMTMAKQDPTFLKKAFEVVMDECRSTGFSNPILPQNASPSFRPAHRLPAPLHQQPPGVPSSSSGGRIQSHQQQAGSSPGTLYLPPQLLPKAYVQGASLLGPTSRYSNTPPTTSYTQITPYAAIPEGWVVDAPIRKQPKPTNRDERVIYASFHYFFEYNRLNCLSNVRPSKFHWSPWGWHDERRVNELNHGGKILLPNSCLDTLMRRNIQWPMLFKLTNLNPEVQKVTHAGVLEFLAEEGRCYLPSWLMNQLQLEEGDLILVEYKALPNATFAKFKPMSTDFYSVSNPRAMLEVELRKFSCLTKGDIIAVQYNDQVYEFQVKDLKPENAATWNRQADQIRLLMCGKKRLMYSCHSDGPSATSAASAGRQSSGTASASSSQTDTYGGPPSIAVDENYTPGELHFVRQPYKSKAQKEKEAREMDGAGGGLKPFEGKGNTIR